MKMRFMMVMLWVITAAGPAAAERMTVNVPMANVRSGPGTQYKILWKLEKNHPIEVIKKKEDWYYFKDFQNDKGWVSNDVLTQAPSVIVIKDQSNVRSGPGTRFDVIFAVEQGVPFMVIKREKEWIHIQHADGDKGWIHESLVW
jgi:uncharacterized protein YgiM (DUF1202 family)